MTLVINFDVPVERDQRTPNYETYLHRIGRSGRFGRKGAAFNLLVGMDVRSWPHLSVKCSSGFQVFELPVLFCVICVSHHEARVGDDSNKLPPPLAPSFHGGG